jgi:CDP-diacylglycerol---glycerol-3-phosphate 3-phosphatidyltransferase
LLTFVDCKNDQMSQNWKIVGQSFAYRVLEPMINFLAKVGITPNMITVFGLLLNVLAAVLLIYGAEKTDRLDHTIVGWAGLVILIGGLMDMIDGRLARVHKMDSPYGAMFDSVMDRYSEMIMFLGICYYLVAQNYFYSSLFGFLAMVGSIMVSYTRARAEGLGLKMSDVGLMQRPERIITIGVSSILCGVFSYWRPSWFPFEAIVLFTAPLFAMTILANYTAVDRLNFSKKQLLGKK